MTNFEQLSRYGQEHLIRYMDELTEEEKNSLIEQINSADFTLLEELKNKDDKMVTEESAGELSPLGA